MLANLITGQPIWLLDHNGYQNTRNLITDVSMYKAENIKKSRIAARWW